MKLVKLLISAILLALGCYLLVACHPGVYGQKATKRTHKLHQQCPAHLKR